MSNGVSWSKPSIEKNISILDHYNIVHPSNVECH